MATDVSSRQRRFGLRARVTASFALLSALLSLVLSVATYVLIRGNAVQRREAIIENVAFSNARLVRQQLLTESGTGRAGSTVSTDFLQRSPVDGTAVLRHSGRTYYTSSSFLDGTFDPEFDIPTALGAAVADHRTVVQRVRLKDVPVLVVGVPLRLTTAAAGSLSATGDSLEGGEAWAEYFELASLDDVEGLLDTLLVALAAVGVSTTLAGVVVGRRVSRRVLAPLEDVNNAVRALATMSADATLPPTGDPDLAPLVSSFNDTVAALQERIERDGRFASDVSHELRSPLTTLTNSIAVLQRHEAELPDPARRAVALLGAEFERFQQLVGDLLEISRFDAGAQHLERSPLVLGEFIRQAARLTCPEGTPVVVDADLEETVIMADKRRLVQVLSNLAQNATRYADGVTELTVTRARGGVELAVLDRGPGVPPAERQRIFDRFSRGVTAGNRGNDQGTGLGLALVSEHVHLHGGTVRVDDRPDGDPGACFVVYLPANPVSIYDTEEDFEAAGIGTDR